MFCFLKGQHILDQGFITITGVSNLTWQGIGAMELGPHETMMQSTVVIKCNRSTGGFRYTESQFVTILNITLADCAADYYLLVWDLKICSTLTCDISQFVILLVQGLLVLNCFNITIEDSLFFYNQFPVDELFGYGTNVQVVYLSWTLTALNRF